MCIVILPSSGSAFFPHTNNLPAAAVGGGVRLSCRSAGRPCRLPRAPVCEKRIWTWSSCRWSLKTTHNNVLRHTHHSTNWPPYANLGLSLRPARNKWLVISARCCRVARSGDVTLHLVTHHQHKATLLSVRRWLGGVVESTDYTRGNTAQLILRNCKAMLHVARLQGQTISGSIPFHCSSLPTTPPTGTWGAPILSQGLRLTQSCPCAHYEATWGSEGVAPLILHLGTR